MEFEVQAKLSLSVQVLVKTCFRAPFPMKTGPCLCHFAFIVACRQRRALSLRDTKVHLHHFGRQNQATADLSEHVL